MGVKKMNASFKKGLNYLAKGGLRTIFNRIDQLGIKKGVDTLGLEKFINHCALLAAGSGVITGMGGITTAMIGVPLDMANLLLQQFRVTLAVSYSQTGHYKVKFDDFIKIMAATLKVDAKMSLTKNIMEEVAEKLLINIGSKTAERLVPIAGAVIGGSVNYLFIKNTARSLINEQAMNNK